MTAKPEDEETTGSETLSRRNLSTENQPDGAARRPSDTLDRKPERDPQSGGSIPSDYDPVTMTRRGEETSSRAAREGAGKRPGSSKGENDGRA